MFKQISAFSIKKQLLNNLHEVCDTAVVLTVDCVGYWVKWSKLQLPLFLEHMHVSLSPHALSLPHVSMPLLYTVNNTVLGNLFLL